jgi:hypothetical protein
LLHDPEYGLHLFLVLLIQFLEELLGFEEVKERVQQLNHGYYKANNLHKALLVVNGSAHCLDRATLTVDKHSDLDDASGFEFELLNEFVQLTVLVLLVQPVLLRAEDKHKLVQN